MWIAELFLIVKVVFKNQIMSWYHTLNKENELPKLGCLQISVEERKHNKKQQQMVKCNSQ